MKYISLILLLTQAACTASTCKVLPVSVKLPVAVGCGLPDIPEPGWKLAGLAPDAHAPERLKALISDWSAGRYYNEELKLALEACS